MQVGDFILVDGKQATIKTKHAAGKHVQYVLSDGRMLLDLHLRSDVTVPAPVPKKDRLGMDILPGAEFGEDSHD